MIIDQEGTESNADNSGNIPCKMAEARDEVTDKQYFIAILFKPHRNFLNAAGMQKDELSILGEEGDTQLLTDEISSRRSDCGSEESV